MSTNTVNPSEWSPFEGVKLTAYAIEHNGSFNAAIAKAYDELLGCNTRNNGLEDVLREYDLLRPNT